MSEYKDGKAHRDALGSSPRKSSTPATHDIGDQKLGTFPVARHGEVAHDHVETVGWMNDTFHEPTHPNIGKHGNSGTQESRDSFRRTDLNKEKLKPKSGGFNT